MAEELTRKQLQEKLDAANEKIAAMEAPPDAITAARLADAEAELARLRRPQPSGGAQKHVPYKGFVQATEDCHFGGVYRDGPKEGKPGVIFDADLPVLWTDDPFVPVIVRTSEDTGLPIAHRNEEAIQTRVDFRFRAKGLAETNLTPLRASSF